MTGTLYVVGTPIGNMDDITLRQLKTLEDVDFIAAEDTRVTLKLLNRYDIKKQLISYHGHSTLNCAENIISRIKGGENAAVVTDAGMPCISDPGEELVRLCAESGINVKVVPGPSAVVSARAVSGLNTSRFAFEGFLSVNKKQRSDHLLSLKDETRTLIFYEAPHKLINTLNDFLKYFGDRRISLCRELTKVYEEVLRMTVSEAILYYENNNPKGEYVLVLEGAERRDISDGYTLETASALASEYADDGMKLSEACRKAAKETGFSRSGIYSFIVNHQPEEKKI